MAARIDRDHVRAVSQVTGAGHDQLVVVQVQDGDRAAFRRDVEPVGGLVVGQHVRVFEMADPFTGTVKVTVSRLRAKLGEPPVIVTVAQAGYQI